MIKMNKNILFFVICFLFSANLHALTVLSFEYQTKEGEILKEVLLKFHEEGLPKEILEKLIIENKKKNPEIIYWVRFGGWEKLHLFVSERYANKKLLKDYLIGGHYEEFQSEKNIKIYYKLSGFESKATVPDVETSSYNSITGFGASYYYPSFLVHELDLEKQSIRKEATYRFIADLNIIKFKNLKSTTDTSLNVDLNPALNFSGELGYLGGDHSLVPFVSLEKNALYDMEYNSISGQSTIRTNTLLWANLGIDYTFEFAHSHFKIGYAYGSAIVNATQLNDINGNAVNSSNANASVTGSRSVIFFDYIFRNRISLFGNSTSYTFSGSGLAYSITAFEMGIGILF